MARTALLAVVLALAAATPSQAAVVRADITRDRGGGSITVRFEAAPGERNDVTATRDAGGSYIVRDLGASLTAAEGCVSVDANTASCATPPFICDTRLEIAAGDLDDVVTTAGAQVRGGEGDDILRGGGSLGGDAGDDTLEGGQASDRLAGGPGADVVRGGDGDDTLMGDAEGSLLGATLVDAGGGDDLIDGGAGNDGVDYGYRTTPVAVDLAEPSPDGGAGEGDVLVGIENAGGGSAGDVLAGDEGDNRLGGGAGDDRIDGRGGADRLSDGIGTDILAGGEGDDRLTVGGAAVFDSQTPFPPLGPGDTGDVARGGEGADTIVAAGRGLILDAGPGDDRFALGAVDGQVLCGDGRDGVSGQLDGRRLDGCELAILSGFDLLSVAVIPLPRARGRVDVPLSCRPRGSSVIVRCRVAVSVRLRRRGAPPVALGRARVSVAEGRSGVARIGPDRRGRRALAAAKRPLLEIGIEGEGVFSSSFHAPGGVKVSQPITGRWTVRLPEVARDVVEL